MADMRYGLDPAFRFAAQRAVYKGILRYLNGAQGVVQPLPVKELGINASGLLQWKAETDSLEPGANPSYYMVYIQEDDGEWNVQQVDKATQIQLELKQGVKYNYYVVAGNDGGLSFPSPVISAYLNDQTANEQMVLVLDAFNDVYGPQWFTDSTYAGIVPGSYACENGFSCAYIGQQWDYRKDSRCLNDDNCGFGACFRDHAGQLTVGNTHDYATRHGRVLRKMGLSYVSCTAGFAQIDSTYSFVDVVCGRNRQPLCDTLYSQLASYLSKGGRLLISSDHVDAMDQNWIKTHLHASFYAPYATRSGRISYPRNRLYQLVMEPNEEQLFTPSPQGLKPETGAVRVAEYQDMRCAAAVGYEHKTLFYGFPLEAVMDFEKIYKHSIEWLLDKE